MEIVTRVDEDLLLDLLNTTPVVDGVRLDEFGSLPQAQDWAVARGGVGTAAEAEQLRRVRDAIQAVSRGDSPAQALQADLGQVRLHPQLSESGLSWHLRVPADQVLAARAMLAWASIHARSPERLRPCANPECCRFLLDRSNANTARWCSMALCGNRSKVRRHYQRNRATEE